MWINDQVARRLEEVADLLHEQGANIFRVQAYSRAANTVRRLATPVSEILQHEGIDGLKGLPGIGDHLAVAMPAASQTSAPVNRMENSRNMP